jgi:hypothetical protein
MKTYRPTKCAGAFGAKCRQQAEKKYPFTPPGGGPKSGRYYCKACHGKLKAFYKADAEKGGE